MKTVMTFLLLASRGKTSYLPFVLARPELSTLFVVKGSYNLVLNVLSNKHEQLGSE